MPDHPTPIDDDALDAMIAEIGAEIRAKHPDQEHHETVRLYESYVAKGIADHAKAVEDLAGDPTRSRLRKAVEGARSNVRTYAGFLVRRALYHESELRGGRPRGDHGIPMPKDVSGVLRRYLPAEHPADPALADQPSEGPRT